MTGIFYHFVGYITLNIKYRNKSKRKEILLKNYDNQYYIAGTELIWKSFAIVFGAILVICLLAIIYRLLFFGPTEP